MKRVRQWSICPFSESEAIVCRYGQNAYNGDALTSAARRRGGHSDRAAINTARSRQAPGIRSIADKAETRSASSGPLSLRSPYARPNGDGPELIDSSFDAGRIDYPVQHLGRCASRRNRRCTALPSHHKHQQQATGRAARARGSTSSRTEGPIHSTVSSATGTVYRYARFTRGILFKDMAFRGGPSPGLPMPDFDLPTTDGGRVRLRDFIGKRPVVLVCTSITCPMAATMGPELRRLHSEFGDRIAFIALYVREAHPGERYPQPDTLEQKLAHARAYQALDPFPWPVAVDGPDGELHRALDPRPNAAYLVDTRGNVAFRSLASNDERVLREGLHRLVAGHPLPIGEREPRMVPRLKAVGVMREVLNLAGQEAKRDVRKELPGSIRCSAWQRCSAHSRRSPEVLPRSRSAGVALLRYLAA